MKVFNKGTSCPDLDFIKHHSGGHEEIDGEEGKAGERQSSRKLRHPLLRARTKAEGVGKKGRS